MRADRGRGPPPIRRARRAGTAPGHLEDGLNNSSGTGNSAEGDPRQDPHGNIVVEGHVDTTPTKTMAVFDRLPAQVRQALAACPENLACEPFFVSWQRGELAAEALAAWISSLSRKIITFWEEQRAAGEPPYGPPDAERPETSGQ